MRLHRLHLSSGRSDPSVRMTLTGFRFLVGDCIRGNCLFVRLCGYTFEDASPSRLFRLPMSSEAS